MSVSGTFVVMGVCGCGKSEIGQRLAEATGGRFIDGDDLHPAENIAKMSAGIPLTDADRFPWLDKVGAALKGERGPVFIACSALKRIYRERIGQEAEQPITFLFLEGTREVLEQRVSHRPGHFMPAALLDSQLAALEPPQADELSHKASIDQPPEKVTDALLASIGRKEA